MAPSAADWLGAVGSLGAAWVAVGALLYDRHARRVAETQAFRDVHAWVRWVDDDPDIDDAWILYLSNGTRAPIQSWYVELNTAEGLGSGDIGPLPPGTLRRRIDPSIGDESVQRTPRVARLVFRDPRGSIFQRAGHDSVQELKSWPAYAAGDDMLASADDEESP